MYKPIHDLYTPVDNADHWWLITQQQYLNHRLTNQTKTMPLLTVYEHQTIYTSVGERNGHIQRQNNA